MSAPDWNALLDQFIAAEAGLAIRLVAARDGATVASRGDVALFEQARLTIPVFGSLLAVRREPSMKLSFYKSKEPLAFAMFAVTEGNAVYGDVQMVCRREKAESMAARAKVFIGELQSRGFSTHLDASQIDKYLLEIED